MHYNNVVGGVHMKYVDPPDIYRSEAFENIHGIHITLNTIQNNKPHRHDFYEFDYVLEGEGQCSINDKCYHFRKGDLTFTTPLDYHSYTAEHKVRIITVHFHPDNLSDELAFLSDIEACTVGCPDELQTAFEELYRERNVEDFRYLVRKNLLERAVILFLRVHSVGRKTDMPPRLIHAVGYINQNFTSHIDLAAMCEKTHYSAEHFCRQFKKYTKMTFIEYLTDVRITHARNLLMSKSMPMTQLSYECGFGDVKSFNRAFKKKYGCTPKEYKKQNEANAEAKYET